MASTLQGRHGWGRLTKSRARATLREWRWGGTWAHLCVGTGGERSGSVVGSSRSVVVGPGGTKSRTRATLREWRQGGTWLAAVEASSVARVGQVAC